MLLPRSPLELARPHCVPGATFFDNSGIVTGIHLKNRRDAATMRALSFHIGSYSSRPHETAVRNSVFSECRSK
jgi:hypothetical protein